MTGKHVQRERGKAEVIPAQAHPGPQGHTASAVRGLDGANKVTFEVTSKISQNVHERHR